MIFDYCEFEKTEEGRLTVITGCRFEDEPDELYVIHLNTLQDGTVRKLTLYFNGHDCSYTFKAEEAEAVLAYAAEVIPSSAYAGWYEGELRIV
ncbi:hypothetical protein [Paenibacillus piri]|uniref:Uncharacterized protein n=1 Tax=Paenibacillus piri TaxID=2547395 RepID=A0A4R5KTM4_9BACL|nr:hypothetical protein [Paenibacillus piri]TDF99253.1 hypothetical protein E1757_05170 [Paenibacillus piri]